jgi:hypothetical protein
LEGVGGVERGRSRGKKKVVPAPVDPKTPADPLLASPEGQEEIPDTEPGNPDIEEQPAWIPDAFLGSGEDDLKNLQDHWGELVSHCGMLQPALRGHLRDSWPVAVSETVLDIGFDPEFGAEIAEVRAMDHGSLHGMFSQLLGRSIRLRFQLLDKPVTWSHVSGAPSEQAASAEFQIDQAGADPKAWLQNDSVRKVLEMFNGEIVDIQPSIPIKGDS